MREHRGDVSGGVHHLDGALLGAPVPGPADPVANRDGGPVEAVEGAEQLRVLPLTVIT